jgi:hypothetical protein
MFDNVPFLSDILIGKVNIDQTPTLQISTIGYLFPHDVRYLLRAVAAILQDMKVQLPLYYC